MHVPFNDLYRQYLSLKDELDTAISETIRNSAFVRGPAVEMFEEQSMVRNNSCDTFELIFGRNFSIISSSKLEHG